MTTSLPILAIDDEREPLLCCKVALRYAGFPEVICCQDSREAMGLLAKQPTGVVLLDLSMPHISGEELLAQIRTQYPEIPVIIMTGANDVETAVRCMQAGAFDYMVKPVEEPRLVSGTRRALEFHELQIENELLHTRLQSRRLECPEAFAEFIGSDAVTQPLFQYVETIARTERPVLITGETGVGKDLIARALHTVSQRSGPFVPVNVAGLDDTVFSDTLFGHLRGAFTGADAPRAGMVEQAAEGTLFLDEIGDLAMSSQVKLLRLLQEKEYLPLGSDIPRRSTARIIVATNQDLLRRIESGAFRRDLYYRLQTHHVRIPSLRERLEDLPILIDHFLEKSAAALNKRKPTPPRELSTLLATHTFPGNVRELEGMIFEAVSHHTGGVLSMESFRRNLSAGNSPAPADNQSENDTPPFTVTGKFPTLREATEYLVDEAMRRAKENQTVAARLLGISRPALSKRMKQRAEDGENEMLED